MTSLEEGIINEIRTFLTPDEWKTLKMTCKYLRRTINSTRKIIRFTHKQIPLRFLENIMTDSPKLEILSFGPEVLTI